MCMRQFTLKALLRDGPTTAIDFEAGIRDVSNWCASQDGKQQVNCGHVCCAAFARAAVLDGPDIAEQGHEMRTLFTKILPATAARAKAEGRCMGWNATIPDKLQLTQILSIIDDELRQGALGVGAPVGYMTHGIASCEMHKHQEIAGKCGRITNAHTRFAGVLPPNSGALGIQELVCNAMVLNAPVICAHLNSIQDWEFTIPFVNKARANGHKIFGEVHPHNAGSTAAAADAILPDGMKSLGISYEDIYCVEPCERWTKEIYDKRMETPGRTIVIENNKEEDIVKWMADPETILCSDAMPALDSKGDTFPWDTPFEGHSVHPRTSGTRGKFLCLVREDNGMDVPLMMAISRMTHLPAKCFFELGGIPHFRFKGRMQEGCDADIVVFDPDTVTDNSNCGVGNGLLPTTGIPLSWSTVSWLSRILKLSQSFRESPFVFLLSPEVASIRLRSTRPIVPAWE